MKKEIREAFVALAFFGALTVGSSANAATLFADSFDRPDNTNLNASSSGKSGGLGALDWIEVKSAGEPQILGNVMRLGESGNGGGGWSIAYVDHNFTDPVISDTGEFTVSFDLPDAASSGFTRFTGFAVGHSKSEVDSWAANTPPTFSSDFFFGYDTTGTNEVKGFANGTEDFQQGVNLDNGGSLSVRFSDITDFNSGSSVDYEAFVNGGSVASGSFNWSGTNENYLTTYSNYTVNQGLVDNFEVTTITVIPEPSAVALLSLAGFALMRRRRATPA